MRCKFLIIFLFSSLSFASVASVSVEQWPVGVSFTKFLEINNLPQRLYQNLDGDGKNMLIEIKGGSEYQVLREEDGKIDQILIPLTSELQLHIFKNKIGTYDIDIIPISYKTKEHLLGINLDVSIYADIVNKTGNKKLADAVNSAIKIFRKEVNFNQLPKGTNIAVYYEQKYILGKPFLQPTIKAITITVKGKESFAFLHKNGFYDKDLEKTYEAVYLTHPLPQGRKTSPFNPKRWHPVLKRYRAHLGNDYAAPKGTPVKAAGNGIITFIGVQSGYGNVIEITHDNTYKTLYAHLNGFAKGLKKGDRVRQNQVIAYVGNTGISTGPHLHFGLYKNGQAINSETVVKLKGKLVVDKNSEFNKSRAIHYKKIQDAKSGNFNPEKIDDYPNYIDFSL